MMLASASHLRRVASVGSNPGFTPRIRRKSLSHTQRFIDAKRILTLYNMTLVRLPLRDDRRLVADPARVTLEHTAPGRPPHDPRIATGSPRHRPGRGLQRGPLPLRTGDLSACAGDIALARRRLAAPGPRTPFAHFKLALKPVFDIASAISII